ncbi:hypothetical protein SB14R_15545 [Pseudomonas oryzihabitans]|nr:hypothetical protein SB14R_15545 [Pseudomonas psychrotolerans]KTT65624.1 hypothetical protein NS383_10075 [Pseudomonas psychrotolerans]
MKSPLPLLTALDPMLAPSIAVCSDTLVYARTCLSGTAYTIIDIGKTLVADRQYPYPTGSLPIR